MWNKDRSCIRLCFNWNALAKAVGFTFGVLFVCLVIKGILRIFSEDKSGWIQEYDRRWKGDRRAIYC